MRLRCPSPLAASCVLVVAALVGTAHADEGMWLVNDFPTAMVEKAYGKTLTPAELLRMQKGAVRLANGCSASFVSNDGLVLTNHHCIRPCLESLSTGGVDLLGKPFVAKTLAQEKRCEKDEANQLLQIDDVTKDVLTATANKAGAQFQAALKAKKAELEGACAGTGEDAKAVRCEVVTLYDGAVFHLYRYRRMQDVRVVFAPEFSMAAFGGDPDNFNFPRYGLDMALVRVWENGKPLATPDFIPLAKEPAKEGDLVFVAGHPGGTERQRTAAQLELQRDVALPWTLLRLAELRGRLDEWMRQKPGRETVGRARLRTVENGLKALRGRHEALAVKGFLDGRRRDDATLAKADPGARSALVDIDEAQKAARALWADHRFLEVGEAFQSELFQHARTVVRLQAERSKENAQRLPEFSDARLPQTLQQLTNKAPIPLDFEEATLAWSLDRWRNLRGVDDPLVKKLLGTKPARDVAAELVRETRLQDPSARAQAAAGTLDLSADVLVAFARAVDEDARRVRKAWEDQVEAPETRAAEALSAARRTVRGKQGAPDATFTLRISYGAVKGTSTAPAMTTVAGLFERAGPSAPFLVSKPWQQQKSKLPMDAAYNLSTTNDIIGGNSGSPLLNADGHIVGLVFDGNLPSLGGRFFYDPAENRTTAVALPVLIVALRDVYGAGFLVDEMNGK